MGAYEQKLHIRRDDAGDVAKQTEALLLHGASLRRCRGCIHRKRVPYSGRSAGKLSEVRESAEEETSLRTGKAMDVWCGQKSADAVVLPDRSLWKDKSTHAGRKGRMLELVKRSGSLWQGGNNRNT